MSIPPVQQHLLENLERVTVERKRSGRLRYRLDGKDRTPQAASVIVRGYAMRDEQGRLVRRVVAIADPQVDLMKGVP